MTSAELLALFPSNQRPLDGISSCAPACIRCSFRSARFLLHHTPIAARVCAARGEKLQGIDCAARDLAGARRVIVGHEVAVPSAMPHIFCREKRCLASCAPARFPRSRLFISFIVADAVVTLAGGRVKETIAIVRQHGGQSWP